MQNNGINDPTMVGQSSITKFEDSVSSVLTPVANVLSVLEYFEGFDAVIVDAPHLLWVLDLIRKLRWIDSQTPCRH